MPFSQILRTWLPLPIGLALGAFGASLFRDSLIGSEGSAEQRLAKVEAELKQAQNRIIALQASDDAQTRHGLFSRGARARTIADGTRNIVEDLKAGRPVTPDDIFRATKPLIRDLAPIFDRMRLKQEREQIDRLSGEFARKYNLNAQQQAALKEWFKERTEQTAKEWTELLGREDTRLEDVARASRNVRPDEGIDSFMETVLTGQKLADFKKQRLGERVERVQHEADGKVQRLDSIVGLDETQRDQVFGIMVRGSRDYDPSMIPEGSKGSIATPVGADPQASVLAILRPEQRAAYEAERKRRRDAEEKNLKELGLSMPPNWQMLDGDL